MSPKEASEILNEPNWSEEFKNRGSNDYAFESVLTSYRKWHFTPLDDGRKKMAPSVEGVIALAILGIMPPRTLPDRPPGLYEEQHDDHAWLVTEGRAWSIVGIEDAMLFLNSFGEERQIDLSRAKWEKYCEHHAAVLEAMRK